MVSMDGSIEESVKFAFSAYEGRSIITVDSFRFASAADETS